MVRIGNTLHIGAICISESMLSEAVRHPDIEVTAEPAQLPFDASGNLTDLARWHRGPGHQGE
jgi:hypothetical protein